MTIKVGDVYIDKQYGNTIIITEVLENIISSIYFDIVYKNLNGTTEYFWYRDQLEKFYTFNQKLTDEQTIKSIIE